MLNQILRTVLLIVSLLLCVAADAEVVVLQSGSEVRGTIVFENDEVVVVRTADGARYQYLRGDIARVLTDEEAAAQGTAEVPEKESAYEKKVAVLLQVGGGAAILPGRTGGGLPQNGGGTNGSEAQCGGAFSADLSIGTANLLGQRIFVGGGIGYHLLQAGSHVCSFIPLTARLEAPLWPAKKRTDGLDDASSSASAAVHSPVLGLAVGYGISATKRVDGGAFAELSLGYRYQTAKQHALLLVLYGNCQQARFAQLSEVIDTSEFVTLHAARVLPSVGLRLGVVL